MRKKRAPFTLIVKFLHMISEKIKSVTRFLAGITALILVPAIFTFFGFAVLVSYNSNLRMFMLLMVIVSAVLSIIHAAKGKYQLPWGICLAVTVGLFQYEAWRVKQDAIDFCKNEVLSECVQDVTGHISCPEGSSYNITFTSYCEEVLQK